MSEKVAKVIEIFTRKEITEPPYPKDIASDIMEYLMLYKNPRSGKPVSKEEYLILDQLLFQVENNSGVMREEVFERNTGT